MANVKKCDVCGRVYAGKKDMVGDIMSSYINIVDHKTYSDDDEIQRVHYDTCPCCMTRIRNFITSLQIDAESGIELTPTQPKRHWFCRM